MQEVKRLQTHTHKLRVNYTKSVNDNPINVLTETIRFKIIRKIFDEHQPVTALCWISY